MSKRKELYDYLKHPGHYFHRIKGRKTGPYLTPHTAKSDELPQSWEELDCNILCKIAHTGLFEYSVMRLICKTWKRELDLCTYEVEPAFSDMQRTLRLFPNVQKLDLSACNLTVQNGDLFLMPGLKKLKVLDLRGCAAMRADGIEALAGCPALEQIDLGRDPVLTPGNTDTFFDSKIEDDILEALAHISSLRSIKIGYSHRCTVQGVLALTQLRQLEKLQIMGHSTVDFGQLSSRDIQKLEQLECLLSLSLGVVAAEAFQALPLLSKLTSLDLHGDTWERTPLNLEDIGYLQHLTDMRHLGLHHYELEGGIKDFTGEDPSTLHFLQCLSKMESFSFDNCEMMPGCELLLLHCCRRLKNLQIHLAANDTYGEESEPLSEDTVEGILEVIESTPEWAVESLEMQGSAAIPKFAAATLTRAPKLRSLIWDCNRCTNEQSTVWHDLGLKRWNCAETLSSLHLRKRVRLNPEEVHCLQSFRQLIDMSCILDNALPASISHLTGLKSLCITWMFGADSGLQLLASLTGLDKLEVSCQEPFTDRGISHLCHLTALTDLVFSSNQAELKVTGQGLKCLGQLTLLVKLELVSSTVFSGQDLKALSSLRFLRHLEIGNVKFITKEVCQALDPLAQLRRLWIRIPKEQIWQERANTIQLCKEDLAHIGATHPVLSWVCFGNQQMMSLPKATVDRRLLEELVEAERSGSLDSIDKPFWLNSDED